MSFVHCILVVFFFAVGEAQIEMLGGTTLHGRDAAVMFPEAQEALFLSDTKQKFGVFHKLVRVEEVSTMGIFTIMQVVVQNTDCQVSHDVSSYNDVLKSAELKKVEESIIIPQRDQRANRRRTIYIDSIDDVEEQVVPQHSQMLGGTTEYTDSDADIKEQVKQAIFETDRKKTNGTYLWLEKL
ncbi:Cysteine--tRNA ligase [Trichinella spiralis]|uniref:Cysteine--tRNA ligase n=1 Tax=Trichinella spiralis TaxID=6334 RepID=A0ABR3KJ33_TRISP